MFVPGAQLRSPGWADAKLCGHLPQGGDAQAPAGQDLQEVHQPRSPTAGEVHGAAGAQDAGQLQAQDVLPLHGRTLSQDRTSTVPNILKAEHNKASQHTLKYAVLIFNMILQYSVKYCLGY